MKIGNLIVAALLLVFITHSAHALDPSQSANSYIQTHFTSDNGLPTDIVTNLVQSRDGFLWVSFGSGTLARFDGQRFTALPVSRVTKLVLGPDGDLWTGTSGGVLIQIQAAALNQFGPLKAIRHPTALGPSEHVICLHFSPSGVLWVG